jgi:hypothetical protein
MPVGQNKTYTVNLKSVSWNFENLSFPFSLSRANGGSIGAMVA